jgi:hypothetical protein
MNTTSTSKKEALWSRICGFFKASSNKLSESFLGNWWRTWTSWGATDTGSRNLLGMVQDLVGSVVSMTWHLPIGVCLISKELFVDPKGAFSKAGYLAYKSCLTLGFLLGLRKKNGKFDLTYLATTLYCGFITWLIGIPLLSAGYLVTGTIFSFAPWIISALMSITEARGFWEITTYKAYTQMKLRSQQDAVAQSQSAYARDIDAVAQNTAYLKAAAAKHDQLEAKADGNYSSGSEAMSELYIKIRDGELNRSQILSLIEESGSGSNQLGFDDEDPVVI